MKREVSVYIDLLRILAALAVVAEHCSNFVGGWVWRFGGFGAEAVAVFFVLSGLVIAHVTASREQTASSYTFARSVRIYSVVLPIMVVTFVLDAIGQRFNPTAYGTALNVAPSTFNLFRCLTFTHQVWNTDTHFGTNGPFWSLGFECAYYAIFGAAFFIRSTAYKAAALIALCLLFGPRIVSYFPLWLLGAGTYLVMQRYFAAKAEHAGGTSHAKESADTMRSTRAIWGCILIASLAAFFALHTWGHAEERYLKIYRRFELTEDYFVTLAYFYAIGLLFAVHIVAFAALSPEWTRFIHRGGRSIRWAAGATFTLYLANLPVLLFLNALLLSVPASELRTTGILLSTIAIALLLAEASERRKNLFANIFKRVAA